MPELRRREYATRAELQSITDQTTDRTAYLRLAETLTGFLARLGFPRLVGFLLRRLQHKRRYSKTHLFDVECSQPSASPSARSQPSGKVASGQLQRR
jgi:hypothetical protein